MRLVPRPSFFQFSWKHFLPRLAFALLCTWLLMMLALANLYVYVLTHPPCQPSAAQQPGFESIAVTNAAGLTLKGWWRPPQNGMVILLVGGLGSNRDAMLPDARLLADHGYGVLTLEQRHCAGVPATLGYAETQDVHAMAAFALAQPGVQRLGGLGFSIGGVALLNASNSQPELQALVIQGNYANLYAEITAAPTRMLSFEWQMQRLVAFFFGVWSGVPARQLSPIDVLPHVQQPLLLIHGEKETQRTRAEAQLQAAASHATLWIVPAAGHGGYHRADPHAYRQRVIGFFESHLGIE